MTAAGGGPFGGPIADFDTRADRFLEPLRRRPASVRLFLTASAVGDFSLVWQVIGLAYGVYVIAMARPVYQVFEVDRMRVVTASDIDPDTLREAVPELQRLPWFGPGVIAAAKPTNPDEVLRSIDLALAGFDIAQFPRHWRPFSSQSAQAWSVARPVAKLVSQYPDATPDLQRIAASANQPADTLRFLPLVSRHASWVTVIAAPDARIVGYLPVDGFF